jgi:HAD superfamily hydrolase (TIGR01458 family)
VHARLRPELADLEGDPPDSVLVGDAGDAFTYAALNRAFRVLHAGAPLLAMASNRYFQEADGLSLDAGPFVAALEHAAGTRAEVLGKPAATFFRAALARLGLDPEQAVMIGDDVEADVIGARAAGLGAVLVATGKHRAGDDERARAAGASCAANLAAAVDLLLRG